MKWDLVTYKDCHLVAPNRTTPSQQNYTGWQQTTNCYAYLDSSNSGCAVIDPSVASYGTQFNELGGGVFAMLWLNDGVRVCTSFQCILFFLSKSQPTDTFLGLVRY